MKRIQLIFLFLITLTILSVVSNREDTNNYSEPVYQDLDRPQFETDLIILFGWQYTLIDR